MRGVTHIDRACYTHYSILWGAATTAHYYGGATLAGKGGKRREMSHMSHLEQPVIVLSPGAYAGV
jgi:hypothetical protein